MTNNVNSKKNTVICIFLALVIIFTLAIPVFGAEAFLEVQYGEGEKISDDFLTANTVKLNGRIYNTGGRGAYFSIMIENENNNSYTEDNMEFHNYKDTGSKLDGDERYLPFIFESKINRYAARRTKINPYRLYNDIKGRAKLTKLS